MLGLTVIVLIGGIVIFYLTAGLTFAISKLIGGKGELATQARFMSIVTLRSNIRSAPLAFISIFFMSVSIPALAISFLVSVIGLYQLYAFYKTIRTIHSISMFRALVALVGTDGADLAACFLSASDDHFVPCIPAMKTASTVA